MQSLLRRIGAMACVLVLCIPLAGQGILIPVKPETPPATEPPPAVDPLGRTTPSGSIFGFLQAAQARNFKTAAQYLQMSVIQRRSQGEDLAEQLKVVMDQGFIGNLQRITTNPEGAPQEGLPLSQLKVGTLAIGDVEGELLLTRVLDPSAGKIWLISAETLAKVPDLYAQVHVNEFESHLPGVLTQREYLGMPLWQWLAMLAAVPVSIGLAWLFLKVFVLPRRLWAHYRKQPVPAKWEAISGPVWLILATLTHIALTRLIGIPLLHRHYFLLIARVVLIAALTWLLLRWESWLMQRLRDRHFNAGRLGAASVILLGERILKVIVVLVAGLAIMSSLGFDMTTALAGLGIGGLAIAFAAQKTLENVFGGVSVLGDEAIRVGDNCQFGDRVGLVEDIGLRSTRIRTVERTELFIPNGSLSTMNVENLSRRDKILFNTKFCLRSETSTDQLRFVLAEARRLLYEHPKIETESARIRFVEFQDSALGLEIFSYILTRDPAEFNAIREDVLFRIMRIIEQAGTSLASPRRTVYFTRDSGLEKQKTEAALQQVERWREEKQLPFPDFPSAEIAEFQGTLPYPEPDSALARRTTRDRPSSVPRRSA